MSTPRKLHHRLLSLFLAILLVIHPAGLSLALAQEETENTAPEQTTEEAQTTLTSSSDSETTDSSLPSDTPDPEPPPDDSTSSENQIQTGNAEAEVQTLTEANLNQTDLPANLTTGCELGLETCPSSEIQLENTNQIDQTTQATASAETGQNQTAGADQLAIETGNATASAQLETDLNLNLTELTAPAATSSAAPSPAATPSALLVENQNQTTNSVQLAVTAETGQNQAHQASQSALIQTGDAQAEANLVNWVNLNTLANHPQILFVDITDSHSENLNLNQLWQETTSSASSSSTLTPAVFASENTSQAVLKNQVTVTAQTGQNQANQNQTTTIETGNARARLNLLNLVNLNLTAVDFVFSVINIFGSLLGDIVVPRQNSQPSSSTPPSAGLTNVANQNQAAVETQLTVTAQTGQNQTVAPNSQILTGQSQSQSRVLNFVNLNYFGDHWASLLINPFGQWQGHIIGYSQPKNQPTPTSELTELFYQPFTPASPTATSPPTLTLQTNQNQVQIENQLTVTANTGHNQALENHSAKIETGDAQAKANVVNFANLNFFGQRWFFSFINVFGRWEGNLIFAYPDLALSLKSSTSQAQPGDLIDYTLIFENRGHDTAHQVVLELPLPPQFSLVKETSGLPFSFSGQTCRWQLDALAPGQQDSFTLTLQVDPQFSFNPQLSFWQRLVPTAHAAETQTLQQEVTLAARLITPDPEPDLANNTAQTLTLVFSSTSTSPSPTEPPHPSSPSGQPVLVVTAQNNVNQFVYPGDVVTFEITVENQGSAPSSDTYLVQELRNHLPDVDFGAVGFELGTLNPGQKLTLRFGFELADDGQLPAGSYLTVTQAFGYAPDGTEVASNTATTSFELRQRLTFTPLAQAAKKEEEPEVLGVTTPACPPPPQPEEPLLPYLLAFFVSTLWIVNFTKRRLN